MSGYPIDLFSGIRYYIEDHERGAFELGAPTTDVLDVTASPQRTSRRSLVVMQSCPATSGLLATGFASSRSS